MDNLNQFYDEYVAYWVNNPRLSVRKSYLGLLGEVRDKSVLDVGCGCGFDMELLSSMGACGTGLDFSERSLQLAKERLGTESKWDLVRADLFNYIPEREYDISILSMVVMHYADMNAVFKKLSQFIKPGGQLLLVTNNPYLVLQDFNLQYPSPGESVAYMHRLYGNDEVVLIEKYLHPFMDYFTLAKRNNLIIEEFVELSNYSQETVFFNPTNRNNIPNFLTFLYRKSL